MCLQDCVDVEIGRITLRSPMTSFLVDASAIHGFHLSLNPPAIARLDSFEPLRKCAPFAEPLAIVCRRDTLQLFM